MASTAQIQQPSAQPTAIERRFYPRIVPLAPIYISIRDAGQCLVLNASENGLLLSTPTELLRNFVARVALPLNGLPKPVLVNVRVLWTSKTRRLAGIQILDVSDQNRQQIRKWGSYVSSRSLHRDVQREPQRKPDQLRVVEPFPMPHGKPKVESASAPKPPLNNSAVAPPPSESRIAPIIKWMAFVAALCLVGAILFRSGAMEHSFARSAATPHANAVVPPPAPDTHANLQSPESTERIGDRDAGSLSHSTSAAKSNSDSSTRASRPDSQPGEVQHDREQKSKLALNTAQNTRKAPHAASVSPATTTLEHNLSSNQSQTNSEREPSATKGITLGATASSDAPPTPNSGGTTSNSSAAARAPAISPAVPPLPVAKEPSANSTHSNDVAPSLPETLAFKSNVAPASSASSRDSAAPVAQPLIQMDPSARQVLEIHLPSGYHAPFFNVPDVTVVKSSSATMRIQRSVRLPSANPHWPFHRNAKIVVGGLISRIDPQSAQIRTGREYVRVHATMAQDGQVTSVWPVSGPVNLIPGVLKAVQGWRYQPTLIDGKPVETQADILVQFHVLPSHSALP
jgi:hypothetical protein